MLKIKSLVSAFVFIFCLASFAKDGEDYVLATDGVPSAVIVISANPTKSAQFAAFELQYHLGKITNSIFEIVPEGTKELSVDLVKIYVGETGAAKSAGLKNDSLKAQEWIVKFSEKSIFLSGRDAQDFIKVVYDTDNLPASANWPGFWEERGSLHAAYDFLEKFCGIRWFNQTESGTCIPATKNLALKSKDIKRAPSFTFRDALGAIGDNPGVYDSYVELWKKDTDGFKAWTDSAYSGLKTKYPNVSHFEAARGKLSHLFLLRMKNGGEINRCNHSFYGFYDRFWEKNAEPNAAKLFVEKRPQYFAKGYEGKPNQLCYTNPELIKQIAQDARDYYDGKKTGLDLGIFWQPKLPNPFPLEPMDNGAFCKCPDCAKLLKDSKLTGAFSSGEYSDYFFRFLNSVALELARTHKDKDIVTLAYMNHASPPDFKLETNIDVQFCFASNRMPYNSDYKIELDLLKKWADEKKKSGRPLGLWLYYTFPKEIADNPAKPFNCFPGFFAHTIGEEFKLFREYGIYGMFHCGFGQEVEAYVTFRLMDDSSLNVDDILNEYFTKLYGKAGGPMRKIYEKIEKRYSSRESYIAKNTFMTIIDGNGAGQPPLKTENMTSFGFRVSQNNTDGKWEDRDFRIRNFRASANSADGKKERILCEGSFKDNWPGKWTVAGDFSFNEKEQSLSLPFDKKDACIVQNFDSQLQKDESLKIEFDLFVKGWDFYRNWQFFVATGIDVKSISGYALTYERNGWNAVPFMDILKLKDLDYQDVKTESPKLYADEKTLYGWSPVPGKDMPQKSLEHEQWFANGEWTHYSLVFSPKEEKTQISVSMKPAEPEKIKISIHQTRSLAWGMLGTSKFMRGIDKLMSDADSLAESDIEKQRIKLFKLSVWDYMKKGKESYGGDVPVER